MSAEAAKNRIAASKVTMVSVSYTDISGVTRSKPVPKSELDSVLKSGFKTARANLDMNTVTPTTPGSKVDISQGDVAIVPDPETLVFPSYSPETARMVGWVVEASGKRSALCARTALQKQLQRLRSSGFSVVVGLESEFHLVRLTNGHPVPADKSGIQTQAGFDQHRPFFTDIVRELESVEVGPVKAHVEGGRGQMEIDLAPQAGLKGADGYVYFKDVVKGVAMMHGLTASFMPKIGADWWGNGLHVHLNLADLKGRNVFADSKDRKGLGLSRTCYSFIAGILEHAASLSAVAAPTVNSYKRLLPGRWNTDAITFGPGNRGAAVRIPDEWGNATRIELRMPDNSCNVYLMLACVLAAGRDGIERRLDPGKPLTFDASVMTDRGRRARGLKLLPRSLGEALGEFEKDQTLRKSLGEALFQEFLLQKSFEVSQAADQVTDWEVSHYLDLF